MSTPPRTRVLFIAEAVTLAHVARADALARSLDGDRFEICVASDPRYAALFGTPPFEARTIETIPSERFANAIERGQPIYDLATLARYVDEDRRVIAAFGPDVIVGDFRLSLSVSARLSRIPYVTITNAGWSPYANIRFVVPDLPMTGWFGVPVAQKLFDFGRPIAFAAHARPLNRLRSRFGLPRLQGDIRTTYTDADFILYADLAELFSMRTMPESHAFLGPVLWSPAGTLPAWWSSLDAGRPVIYVSLGSSGKSRVVPAIVDALAGLPVWIVVSTAGRTKLGPMPSNVFVADFLPGATAAARADLVISNGGSPTCYQAFEAGTPVIGVPTNLDQYLNMEAVSGSGAGLMLRPSALNAASIRHAVETVLRTSSYRSNAQRLQRAIAARPAGAALARVLERAGTGAIAA